MFRFKCIVAALIWLLMASATASSATGEFAIELVVTGADPDIGDIKASLYDSSESYMRDALVEATADVDANGFVRIDFGSHRPGQYAIVVFYDKNANGELDTGFLRIPKEKVGFSNNAKGRFGPAKWVDAQFSLEESNLQIAIQLTRATQD